MAKSAYIGVSSKAKKVKKIYIGVGGVAKKVKKAYIGVNGVAKLFYAAGGVFLGTGGTYSPYEYDSSTGIKTDLPAPIPNKLSNRQTTLQYCKGKWVWAQGGIDSSSAAIYIHVMDEKTYNVTSTQIRNTSTGFVYGFVRGLESDDDHVYLLVVGTNDGTSTYFVTMNISDYSYTATKITDFYRPSGNTGDKSSSLMVMLPNGKFLMTTGGSYPYPTVYDKSNNTCSLLSSNYYANYLQNRAVSASKAVFIINGYNLGVTDGSTITIWNDSAGELTPYNSAEMTYGNGKFVYCSANAFFISTDNGTTWTKKRGNNMPTKAGAMTFGGGLFVNANYSNRRLDISEDGENWTANVASLTFDTVHYAVLAYSAPHGFER